MSVVVERDVAGAMRDGTLLRADVYRPEAPGPHPVLLRRTPYGKQCFDGLARTLAARGYLVVVQDIRGRHASDGEWIWAFAEAAQEIEAHDGHDAVEWAATLPHADGTVGTWGHSYDAWTSWRLAAERPPSLRGILAAGITMGVLDVTRGILDVGRRLEWCYLEAADARRRAGAHDGPATADAARLAWTEVERGKWLWFNPLDEIPDQVFSTITSALKRYCREVDRELWAFDRVHPLIEVPTCTVTGWWDRFSRGVANFEGMVRNGPEATRDQHRLVVGPWSHDPGGYTSGFADLDPGPGAARDFADVVTGFFDPLLKGAEDPVTVNERARFFTLGIDRWQTAATWPPGDAEERRMFLHGGGRANTTGGDGRLSFEAPGDEPPDRYVYDPRDPVMSLMGADAQLAPRDQSPNDARADKLVYQSEPLERELEVSGHVRVELWAGSDAPDTDWVARLIRVGADGKAINLAEGIQRARHRAGFDAPAPLTGDGAVHYTLELAPVSVVFRPGERIRLDVTSSDFPNFDRNHNTGESFWSDAELRPCAQAVFHCSEHPSHVVLPVRRGV